METEKSSFDRILFAIIYHLYLVCLPIIFWQYIVSDKSHRDSHHMNTRALKMRDDVYSYYVHRGTNFDISIYKNTCISKSSLVLPLVCSEVYFHNLILR